MKLPGITYSQGVKPLATKPSGAEAMLAAAETEAAAFQEFSKVALNVASGIAESQGDEMFADATLALQQSYADAMTMPNALEAPEAFKQSAEAIRSRAKEQMGPLSFMAFEKKFNPQTQNLHKRSIIDSTFRANKEQRESSSAKSLELARKGEQRY